MVPSLMGFDAVVAFLHFHNIKVYVSKKAKKNNEIFTADLMFTIQVSVKLTVKISSFFVAFLENVNLIRTYFQHTVLEEKTRLYGRNVRCASN